MRYPICFGLMLTAAVPAAAHDFWIQPRNWQATTTLPSVFFVEVGHGPDRTKWESGADRIISLRDYSGGRAEDLKPSFNAGGLAPHIIQQFTTPGLHIVAMTTTNAPSNLPALRFNDYLKAEGLTPAIAYRARTRTDDQPGRERYSRRTKTLVQVGPVTAADTRLATRPLGQSLEIVPHRNPYALAADRKLPVRVMFLGKPLAGALVKLTDLDHDAKPVATARTDARGNAVFTIPDKGSWLVNTIWTRRVASTTEDYETIFASLTFGWTPQRPR